jgi:RNA polymerase sigma-70 factor (ECF subfamily)
MSIGRDKEQAAWLAQLLAEHGRALVLYARGCCDAPEDVVQDALIELIGQRERPERVAAWLFRVVRNKAISRRRSEQRRQGRERNFAQQESWFEDHAQALDAVAAAEALAGLSPERREAVVARIWGELTFAEIAELLGTSTSSAQRWYDEGLRELKRQLSGGLCKTNDPKSPN